MKLLIWGTGRYCLEIFGVRINAADVVAFIDRDPNKAVFMTKKVIRPYEIPDMEYDMIVVASGFANEIYLQCKKLHLDFNKILFLYNNYSIDDLNCNYDKAAELFGDEYVNIIKNRYHVIRRMKIDESDWKRFDVGEGMFQADYVRIRTMLLVADEIKQNGIEGEIAELGVFKGEFAKYLNQVFNDKKLYLFDTFQGFSEEEVGREVIQGHCSEAMREVFKDTTLEAVMNKMPYRNQVVIKQGFFPESLKNLEEQFSLVSIDVDFEESTYEGLKYFYPRLSIGGYIFIHDYNDNRLIGIKNAIRQYEYELGHSMAKVPISDASGSLIITK